MNRIEENTHTNRSLIKGEKNPSLFDDQMICIS